MRTAIGILAICGVVVGLALTVGTAQDRFTGDDPFAVDRPAPKRTAQYFSRGGQPEAADSAPAPGHARGTGSPFRRPDEISAAEPPDADPFGAAFEEDAPPPPPRDLSDRTVSPASALLIAEPAAADLAPPEPRKTPDLTGLGLLPHAGRPSDGETPTPLVTVRWVKRSDVNVGQEARCDLVVKNGGTVPAHDVSVEARFPDTVRLTSADPMPSDGRNRLVWAFEQIAPGEEKAIQISMIPSRRGELATTAVVRFTGTAAGSFTVSEPMLKVAIAGPTEVMLGDPASQTITVSNPGTGTAESVVIEALIPEGLEHPRGGRLAMKVGSLGPGESRKVRLALAAMVGGKHTIRVEASSAATLKQQATSELHVVAPSVKVAIDGPSLRYLGRNATYVLTVTNDGAASSNNVRVMHQVPDGFTFLRADRGGQFDPERRTVNWFLGRLDPGQSLQVRTELATAQLGTHLHLAGAVSEHGTRSEAQFETEIDGTASLVLEVLDLDDPVEVGVETAYEVRVRNEGSKAATDVSVLCDLPPGVELVAAKGPTAAATDGDRVGFKPLDSLPPGKTALFRLQVRGKAAGNHRFRARLASDSIREPLTFEELTKFYVD